MKTIKKLIKWIRNKTVFKRIDINLSAPICDCDEQSLTWAISHYGGGPGMELECSQCNTKLQIPHKKFMARFIFDKPYPGKKEKKTKPELKALDGGKVIEFNKENKPEAENSQE